MARRASSGLNTKVLLPVLGGVALIVILFVIFSGGSDKTRVSQADFPVKDYVSRGSSLRNNEYTLEGKVIELSGSAIGDMASVQVQDGGQNYFIPVFIKPEARKGVNIEREQKYAFRIKVENLGNNKGIIFASSIQPL